VSHTIGVMEGMLLLKIIATVRFDALIVDRKQSVAIVIINED